MNYCIVIGVAFLAVVLPVIFHIASSPFLLFLLSPFVVVLLGLLFLSFNVLVGHFLDKRQSSHNDLHQAANPFAFSTPAAWQAVLTRSQWSQNTPQSFPPLCPDAPHLSAALNDILIMIVRDFVLIWYKELSPSPSFPMAVSSVLHDSLGKLLDRAAAIDIPALVVKRILPKITVHVEQFRQSEVTLRGAGLERKLTQSEELDMLLASRYATKGIGRLHPAIENLSTTFTQQSEEMHLRQLIEKALPHVLPEEESKSKIYKLVVREVLVCAVLQPLMDMISDPDFCNRVIDQVAGAAIHQQKLISKVRNVLEAQSPRTQARLSTITSAPVTELITIRTDIRQFESFVRSIKRCSSLLDARRLKNDVVGEIRRTRLLLANHEKEEWINGEKTEDVVAFLDRLYTAKRKVEERIVTLGGEESPSIYQDAGAKLGLTLRDVLSNPSSLSYFMEFMDRRHRSMLVQFWLTVESFKNPLESIDSASSDDEEEPVQDRTTLATVREDISMINDLYFSGPAPHPTLSSISKKHVDVIRSFTQSPSPPSPTAQRKVRRSVMLAQRQVEREMEQDFDDFGRSELWFRAIGDTDFPNRKASPPEPYPPEPYPSSHVRTVSIPETGHPSPPGPSRGRSQQSLPLVEHILAPGMERTISSSHRSTVGNIAAAPSSRVLPTNIEVLMSPVTESSTDTSRAPLFDDPEDQLQREEERRMEAIKAALTDIIALDQEPSKDDSSVRASSITRTSTSGKRRAVFSDNDEDIAEDDVDDVAPDDSGGDRGSYQLAAPGDLQLSYEIARLGDNITNLQAQDMMLGNLIKKAELTGDTQELKLLTRSRSSMKRDLRELTFQKLQYEQQEAANRLLPDRTRVSIVNSTVGDEDGKSVVRYLIEVQQLASDGSFASGWVVARRYNEFFSMHTKLRERYGLVRNLDFPGKRLVGALSGSFLDTRRVALEKYLQSVVSIPIVCESGELREFLSRESPFVASESKTRATTKGTTFSGTDLVRTVYRSVAESIDDMFFGPSMLDVMIQRLTRHAAEFAGIVGSGINDEDLVAQALNASGKSSPEAAFMQLSGDLKPLEGETSSSTFSSPICDFVLAIFELNKKNNWLRRQAIVIILQQVLGGTIERKIRENARVFLDEGRILPFVKLFRDQLWPGGKFRLSGTARTSEEKIRTRDEANRKLSSLIPDLAANMIGRSNARRGARRMFAVLQNRRLNQHIAYTVVDEVFAALFPESNVKT